jgi:hypothetical protein
MRDKDSMLLEGLYDHVSNVNNILEIFDTLGAKADPINADDLVKYINRVLDKSKLKPNQKKGKDKDYFKMPHIHASVAKRVLIQTKDGEKVDLDQFRQILSKRPDRLLKQNAKMVKSKTDNTIFFNTSLPALKGLVVNEDTGEFQIITTCPSAGACQLVCYAKHGSYIMYPDVSLSQNKTLNYLFNDSEGFKDQLIAEINLAVATYKKDKVQIRWNDSGDLLSPTFFKIVMEIVNATPKADHYIYTKEVEMIKKYPNPPQNVIFNFSYGAKIGQEKQIDPVKDKVSFIVDIKNAEKVPELYPITKYKYIEKKGGKWVYNNQDAVKQLIAQKYNIKNIKNLLTIDELAKTPQGQNGQYDVIVLPGESDLSASRRDVRGTYLIIH